MGDARFSILVVDDDEAMLSSVSAILSFDFDVVGCSEPKRALRQMQLRRFHVVCADYLMPSMDGRTLLGEVQKLSSETCCLLMTARHDLAPGDRSFPIAFKPFDPDRFLQTVAHLARIAEMKRSTFALRRAAGQVPGLKRG